jgi:hypothetical protein
MLIPHIKSRIAILIFGGDGTPYSLVNFSKVRCCVNFKTENIIELS